MHPCFRDALDQNLDLLRHRKVSGDLLRVESDKGPMEKPKYHTPDRAAPGDRAQRKRDRLTAPEKSRTTLKAAPTEAAFFIFGDWLMTIEPYYTKRRSQPGDVDQYGFGTGCNPVASSRPGEFDSYRLHDAAGTRLDGYLTFNQD